MKDDLKIKNLKFSYGHQLIICDLNLTLDYGEIHCLLGASGCGKSTLLKLILGLIKPLSGDIILGDSIYNDSKKYIAPEKREVGIVFQDYALFPHLTVYENICFALSKTQKKTSDIQDFISLVKLTNLQKKYPEELSGGEQQRVAIARSLVRNPKLLLLDEAFSNLDPYLKNEIRDEIKDILKKEQITSLFITHDHEEALLLGDRISIMSDGKILQTGTPDTILKKPHKLEIAKFLGKSVFLKKDEAQSLLAIEIASHQTLVIPYSNIMLKKSDDGPLKCLESQSLGFVYRLILEFNNKRTTIFYHESLIPSHSYHLELKDRDHITVF